MAPLAGKIAIVTGSTSGIGEAIARSLAALGARVIVNSSSSVDAGERIAAELVDITFAPILLVVMSAMPSSIPASRRMANSTFW